jgi:hypothetical protein
VAGLLIFPGGFAVMTAGVALWLAGRRWIDRRYFAGSVAVAVATSIFSFVAGIATAIARGAPLCLTWTVIGALSLLFGLRLYRDLQVQPSDEVH